MPSTSLPLLGRLGSSLVTGRPGGLPFGAVTGEASANARVQPREHGRPPLRVHAQAHDCGPRGHGGSLCHIPPAVHPTGIWSCHCILAILIGVAW